MADVTLLLVEDNPGDVALIKQAFADCIQSVVDFWVAIAALPPAPDAADDHTR